MAMLFGRLCHQFVLVVLSRWCNTGHSASSEFGHKQTFGGTNVTCMSDDTRNSNLSLGGRILRIFGIAVVGFLATLAIRYFGLAAAETLGWVLDSRLVDAATVGLLIWSGSFALSKFPLPKDQPIETASANRGGAVVVVFRPSTHVDSLRLHKVLIDDHPVATVADGRSVTIRVAPGRHTLRAEIDWCRSNVLTFDIREGEQSTFRFAPTATGLLLPLVPVLMFAPRFWTRVTQVSGPSRAPAVVGTDD